MPFIADGVTIPSGLRGKLPSLAVSLCYVVCRSAFAWGGKASLLKARTVHIRGNEVDFSATQVIIFCSVRWPKCLLLQHDYFKLANPRILVTDATCHKKRAEFRDFNQPCGRSRHFDRTVLLNKKLACIADKPTSVQVTLGVEPAPPRAFRSQEVVFPSRHQRFLNTQGPYIAIAVQCVFF